MEKRLPVASEKTIHGLRKRIRVLLALFIFGLVISGITAFPLTWETRILHVMIGEGTAIEPHFPRLSQWITLVYTGLHEMDAKYPFMAYGTDWLAFAHIIIAIAFYGPIKDPVKNMWVIDFGMIACMLVIPLAVICGHIRGIPIFWRVIDCSFGMIGVIPLWLIKKDTTTLEKLLGQGSISA